MIRARGLISCAVGHGISVRLYKHRTGFGLFRCLSLRGVDNFFFSHGHSARFLLRWIDMDYEETCPHFLKKSLCEGGLKMPA